MATPVVPGGEWQRTVEKVHRLSEAAARAYPHGKALQVSEQSAGLAHLQEKVRRLSGQITWPDSQENVRVIGEQVAGLASVRDQLQRVSQSLTLGVSQEQLRRVSERLKVGVSQEQLRRVAEQVAQVQALERFRGYPAASNLAQAVERFEHQFEEAGELPGSDDGPSLGWWLATRPLIVQLALVHEGLGVLLAFSLFLEQAGGEDIPDTLQAATALCYAVAAFLLLCITERSKPDD